MGYSKEDKPLIIGTEIVDMSIWIGGGMVV